MEIYARSLVLAAAFGLSACSHWSIAPQRCNPLGGGENEDCLLPYPSSFYSKTDGRTRTGLRVDLTDAALPVSIFGTALDPAPYNERDGFSSAATLLAQFPQKIDPSNLPGPAHPNEALKATSPVQLLRFDTGERVPLFSELDSNAKPGANQALIIQPVVRLRPSTRYIALIQNLRAQDGTEIAPLSGFKKLRDGTSHPGSTLGGERDRFEDIFAKLARAGVTRDKVQLAWDFTTGSDEALHDRMIRMRDEALRHSDEKASDHQALVIDRKENRPLEHILLRLSGSFNSPSFLEDGNGNRLKSGAEGPPASSDARFPITIHVPECAAQANGPLPVMLYGHGTFNSAYKEMSEESSRALIDRLCMIQVGTDWLGRAKSDLPYFLTRILPNWNNFPQITDRLQQAHVNMAVLARLIRTGGLNGIPELRRGGKSLIDEKRLYYYGISEGGCQGVTALALSPDLEKGAMNVPCGFWSMFFWRSSDFELTRPALGLFYPGTLERQKLMVLSQLLWDYTDPANYGGHLLKNPLAGNSTKKILYQEGINDASVPNLTTRAMARTIGLKLLGPGVEPVDGIEESEGPLDSAYVQFDTGIRPRLGGDNVPPAKNAVHEQIRKLEVVQEQLRGFFRPDGKVINTCAGKPCVVHF